MTKKISENKSEVPDGKSSKPELSAVVNDELDRLGSGGPWLWKLFFLCAIPNILNGFHISSYVFLSKLPDNYWCLVDDLTDNLTPLQIRNITGPAPVCEILNLDYKSYRNLSFANIGDLKENTINSTQGEATIHCASQGHNNKYYFDQEEGVSIVPEWNLVCENKGWRSTVQVALSIGKFLGASIFGVIGDRYGRKASYCIGSALYIVAGALTTFSPWYWLFMLGRIGLGAAGAAIFYSSYTILSENVHPMHRSALCLAHSISYPIGMLFLALAANYIDKWRPLQFAISAPALIMILFCWIMTESPRWLISKGREEEVHRILFKKEPDFAMITRPEVPEKEQKVESENESISCSSRLGKFFSELSQLYGTPTIRNRVLICYFNWCAISMSYYITALNADNIKANKVVYVAFTGLVDTAGYLTTIVFCRYMGRKASCWTLFLLAGIALLVVFFIPREHVEWSVFFAMLGRFGISAVYAVMTLHSSEMFPTEIRSSALGTSSTMAHVGSISAPYIVDLLGAIAWYIPTTISGLSILAACILTSFLPETKNKQLKDHVEDEESGDAVKK